MSTYERRPILVLGMQRSGTSCLAGMLVATGATVASAVIRNWDNARGHYEALAAVRLNEAVLSASGGHWLQPPIQVEWENHHAQQRDALLADKTTVIKDPRTLLCLPFWRSSVIPFYSIGIIRHPLRVARSLAAWRHMEFSDSLRLWIAHNQQLLADHKKYNYSLLNFDAPSDELICDFVSICPAVGLTPDIPAITDACDERLIHYDDDEPPAHPLLDEAQQLYDTLLACCVSKNNRHTPTFPRQLLTTFLQHVTKQRWDSLPELAHNALTHCADPAAVLAPMVTSLLRAQQYALAITIISSHQQLISAGLSALLLGKTYLAAGNPLAVTYLQKACTESHPYFDARKLLPHALRKAGRHTDAFVALQTLAHDALYPHGPLAQAAEWAWADGDHNAAFEYMTEAINRAPNRRRGRLRTRLASWLIAKEQTTQAKNELRTALNEDPAYQRAAQLLNTLTS